MALATNYHEHLPAVSLSLVKDVSKPTVITDPSDNQISYAALSSMIFKLMCRVGINQSIIAKANAQAQVDQSSITLAQATNAQAISQTVAKQVDDYMQKLQDAAKSSIWGDIFKWVAAAVVIFIGTLTSEFGVGLVILTAVTLFMTSPLFDMTVKAIGGGLEKLGIPKTWANVIAQVIVIAAITVCTFGIGTAGEAANLAGKGAAAGGQIASNAAQAAAKMALQAMLQALLTSSLVPTLLTQIPGLDKLPAVQAVIGVVITILAAVLAGKFIVSGAAAEGESMLQTIAKKFPKLIADAKNLEYSVAMWGRVARGGAMAAETGARAGEAYYQFSAAGILQALAPLQTIMRFLEGNSGVMKELADQTQATTKSALKTFQTLFSTRFYAGMEAAKAYLV